MSDSSTNDLSPLMKIMLSEKTFLEYPEDPRNVDEYCRILTGSSATSRAKSAMLETLTIWRVRGAVNNLQLFDLVINWCAQIDTDNHRSAQVVKLHRQIWQTVYMLARGETPPELAIPEKEDETIAQDSVENWLREVAATLEELILSGVVRREGLGLLMPAASEALSAQQVEGPYRLGHSLYLALSDEQRLWAADALAEIANRAGSDYRYMEGGQAKRYQAHFVLFRNILCGFVYAGLHGPASLPAILHSKEGAAEVIAGALNSGPQNLVTAVVTWRGDRRDKLSEAIRLTPRHVLAEMLLQATEDLPPQRKLRSV